jgi:hypothetical protein
MGRFCKKAVVLIAAIAMPGGLILLAIYFIHKRFKNGKQ